MNPPQNDGLEKEFSFKCRDSLDVSSLLGLVCLHTTSFHGRRRCWQQRFKTILVCCSILRVKRRAEMRDEFVKMSH